MAEELTWSLVDRIASELGIAWETRRKWRQPRRGVPLGKRIEIAGRLAENGILVTINDFDKLPENPGRIA